MTAPEPQTLGADVLRVSRSALPLYVSMLAGAVSGVVTSAVLGHTSTATLAAFALTSAVYLPALTTVSGAVRGVMPFVSSVSQDRPALRRVLGDGTWLALVVGAVGAAAVALVPALGHLAGVPEATLQQLGVLPWLMAAAVLLSALGSMASSSLVGMGRSAVVMRAGLLSAALTIVVSPVLVLGPGPVPALGLAGAGLAALLAQAAAMGVTLTWLRRQVAFSLVGTLRAGGDPARVLELAKVGLPMAGTVLVKFGVLGVVALAAARVSVPAAAAHSIATSLVGLTFSAAVAVGQAGIPPVSERATRSDVAGVRQAVGAGLAVAGVVVGTLCLVLVAARGPVLAVFTDDPAVVAVMVGVLPVVAAAVVADALQAVCGFGLTGLKRSGDSFVVFAVLYGVLAVIALPTAQALGLRGLWGAVALTNAALVVGQAAAFWRATRRLTPGPPG